MSLIRRTSRSLFLAAMSTSDRAFAGSSPATPAGDQPERAADRGERRAQLVADHRDEIVLHLLDPLLLLDVARHGVDQPLLLHGDRPPGEPAVGAVLGQIAVLEIQHDLARAQPLPLGRGGSPVLRVHELGERPRHQLLAASSRGRSPRTG